MLQASDLRGRAVIDMDSAEDLGKIEEVFLDPEARSIAGFRASSGQRLEVAARETIPQTAVHAVGPTAVTVRRTGGGERTQPDLEALPSLSNVVGRKVVSHGGELLGWVHDVLLETDGKRIVGYALRAASQSGGPLGAWLGLGETHYEYVRADADLRIGDEVIIAPDDALARAEGGEPSSRPRSGRSAEGR